jgi:hypothetical protein
MSTSLRQVHFDRLKNKGPDAAIVIKLMMACNDLSLANQALSEWKSPQPIEKRDQQTAACMYFARIEFAHLHEALQIIRQVESTPSLRQFVDQCDLRTQAAFAKLITYAHGGANHNRIRSLIGNVRDNFTFHYYQCDKLIVDAIDDRATRTESNLSSITRASSAYRWRFKVADDVIDSAVVRKLWAVPREADLRAEVDKIADEIHSVFLLFMDFSGEFIWKYCE